MSSNVIPKKLFLLDQTISFDLDFNLLDILENHEYIGIISKFKYEW